MRDRHGINEEISEINAVLCLRKNLTRDHAESRREIDTLTLTTGAA